MLLEALHRRWVDAARALTEPQWARTFSTPSNRRMSGSIAALRCMPGTEGITSLTSPRCARMGWR
jgi:hypothetical protein